MKTIVTVSWIRDVYFVANLRLIHPLVQLGVREEDPLRAEALPLLQGIRQVDVPATDLGLVLPGEGRGSDANDFHVASCLSFSRGLRVGPLI